jgi:hypothetical protein
MHCAQPFNPTIPDRVSTRPSVAWRAGLARSLAMG